MPARKSTAPKSAPRSVVGETPRAVVAEHEPLLVRPQHQIGETKAAFDARMAEYVEARNARIRAGS